MQLNHPIGVLIFCRNAAVQRKQSSGDHSKVRIGQNKTTDVDDAFDVLNEVVETLIDFVNNHGGTCICHYQLYGPLHLTQTVLVSAFMTPRPRPLVAANVMCLRLCKILLLEEI